MKILHTSDWHLGQSLYGYDRTAEQRDMLRQMVEIVRQQQPDALLVSGDVFHTANPPTQAVKLYNESLLAMHEACPHMQIIVTAGNHDSASRLVVNNDLWDCFGVKVIGSVARHSDEGRTPDYAAQIVEVRSTDDSLAGYVAAIPYCYESNFPVEDPTLQRADRMTAYFAGLNRAVAEVNTAGLPVVLMAHMAVTGCDFAGHDNVGGMETYDASMFGSEFDYVALGHIHTPHNITEHVRYCGTPIPVNFGERFEHSVSIVSVEHGCKPQIATSRIINVIPLHDLPSEPRPLSEVLELAKGYSASELCYLRALVLVDKSMTPLAETLLVEALKGKNCRFCELRAVYPEVAAKPAGEAKTLTGSELRIKKPIEIAEMFFSMKGIEMTPTRRQMIEEATIKADKLRKGDHDEV